MSRKKTKILIVGAGKGGSLLIKIFHKSDLVKILGVVDKNPAAPGIKLAKKLRIPTSTDFKKFIKKKELEEIINVTGNEKVQKEDLSEAFRSEVPEVFKVYLEDLLKEVDLK